MMFETLDSTPQPHAATPEDNSSTSPRRLMDVYLDDAGTYKLMNADEERSRARGIAELRQNHWRSLLSRPSLAQPIVAVARRVLDLEIPSELEHELEQAFASVGTKRDGEAIAHLGRHLDAVADIIAVRDTDRLAADAVVQDLELLARGERGENLQVPTEGSLGRGFRDYHRRVLKSRSQLLSARNRFICANLRLVVRVAQRYGRNRMSLSDRVQEGNLGLMKAVDRFDPDRGTRFSTYAAWWIRHAITRALVNRGRNVRIPAHLHTVFTKMTGAERSLRGKLGREPTLGEISAFIKVPVDKVRLARDAMEMRSEAIDAPGCGEDSRPASEVLEAPMERTVDQVMDDRRNGTLAQAALDSLEPMERDIIEHRFGLRGGQKLTLQKLGERYSLSRERIRQLQNRALAKLRQLIEGDPTPTIAFG